MGSTTDDKIILYTNHRCPWAHRAHIVLSELNIPFEEVIIDLDRPRDPWYLEINPRGLVPSISYNGEIIIESAVVSQFLADAHPSHLVPASNAPGGALKRARINLVVDAFFSKAQPPLFKFFGAKTDEEGETFTNEFLAAVVKEVEPLLKDTNPFFGGSDKLTLAEALIGSFLIRLVAFEKGGVTPASLTTGLKEQAPKFYKWAQDVSAHSSVNNIFDEKLAIELFKQRIAKNRGEE